MRTETFPTKQLMRPRQRHTPAGWQNLVKPMKTDVENLVLLHPGYRTILIDPPWSFKTYSDKGKKKSAEIHYSTMPFERLRKLHIPAAEDACLFLWCIDTHLPEALRLIDAWGFTYKTVAFTWIKTTKDGQPAFGTGYWTRKSSELCLLATRGKPKRLSRGVRQGILEPRREHSRKPDCVYERIEKLVEGPYLEIFARTQKQGWDSIGNESDKFKEE